MTTEAHGYTLLETLCAFAILALTLVFLFTIGGTALNLGHRAQTRTRIRLLAASKLDELAAKHFVLSKHEDGIFPGTDIHWQINASPLGTARAGQRSSHLQKVTLTLRWQRAGRHQSASFITRHLGWGAE